MMWHLVMTVYDHHTRQCACKASGIPVSNRTGVHQSIHPDVDDHTVIQWQLQVARSHQVNDHQDSQLVFMRLSPLGLSLQHVSTSATHKCTANLSPTSTTWRPRCASNRASKFDFFLSRIVLSSHCDSSWRYCALVRASPNQPNLCFISGQK